MCNSPVPCSGKDGQVVYRPCGKCLDCLRQYQQDWTCRLSEEFKAWKGGTVIFFTLTYADTMLPVRVTYNHPITLSSYSVDVRNSECGVFTHRLSLLGLDSFYYTRSLRENTPAFRNMRRCLQDSYLDIPVFERPALFVPTCKYEDVNDWIRYCRKYFDRNVASVTFRKKRVSPYLRSLTWKNIHGVESAFPDSAYTPSFKYWITSEYGPNTLRPHYHGVLFGVDEEMFRDVFAPWWRKHFGDGSRRSVEYSVFDPQKGGAMYIAKYCSKGSFDHPLVTKSIHYPSGKEYISKQYINCVNWFGNFDVDDEGNMISYPLVTKSIHYPSGKEFISKQYINCVNWFGNFDVDDEGNMISYPLCTPPFRLISKGIGVRYPFNAAIQKYWDIQCDEFTDFVCKDSKLKVVPECFLSQLDLGVTCLLEKVSSTDIVSKASAFASTYSVERIESSRRPKVYSRTDFIIDPSKSESDLLQFQNQIYNKEYVRHYIYQNESKVYSCLLPRYYRRFLLSPFSQTALSVVARVRSLDDFNREREFFKSFRQENEKSFALCQKSLSEKIDRRISQKKIADRFCRFYSKSFLGDAL